MSQGRVVQNLSRTCDELRDRLARVERERDIELALRLQYEQRLVDCGAAGNRAPVEVQSQRSLAWAVVAFAGLGLLGSSAVAAVIAPAEDALAVAMMVSTGCALVVVALVLRMLGNGRASQKAVEAPGRAKLQTGSTVAGNPEQGSERFASARERGF